MSFIRKKVSAYPWPVEIRKPSEEVIGEFETHKFTIRFKRLAKKELNDFQEKEDLMKLVMSLQECTNLKIKTVATLFGDAIRMLFSNESVSKLF